LLADGSIPQIGKADLDRKLEEHKKHINKNVGEEIFYYVEKELNVYSTCKGFFILINDIRI